jgi:hypothetical protein
MIAKTYIEQNLKDLERRYGKAKTRKEPLFLSKLAVLELCGWLEISIDDLVCRAVRRSVRDAAVIQNFETDVVKPVYGFHYKKHFRKMMCSAIGEINVHEIERSMDQLKLQQLISELNALTTNRNALAHTYIKGITQNIDAPSRTLGRFRIAYASLKEFESEVFARI